MRIIGVDSRRIGVIFVANTFGIYIHIPFCKSKCDYCDFYSLAGQEEQMDRYQRALLTHLRSFGPRMKGWVADTVYFGGGTPSYYGEKRLREILSLIQRLFTVSRQAEITVECNPDSVDWRSMARLRRSGVNRISLGVQSADPPHPLPQAGGPGGGGHPAGQNQQPEPGPDLRSARSDHGLLGGHAAQGHEPVP